MPKITVITPSIRKEGLKIVEQALKKQTFRDFEWLIGSPFDPEISEAKWVKDDFKGGFWTLNRCWDALFKKANGELIICWQDNIWCPPDTLEKFYNNVLATGEMVTGIGDQYEKIGKYGKPEIKIWNDPRRTKKYGSFYEVNFNDIEFNLAAFLKKLIEEVGGIDIELDFRGYGADLFQVADRLNDLGHRFYIDQTCESYTIRHGREKKDWDEKHILLNGEYQKRKLELLNSGNWPVIQTYSGNGESIGEQLDS